MKKTLAIVLAVAAATAIFLAVMSVKRIPDGYEAVRVSKSGDIRLYGSGYHIVPPSYADYAVYPVGDHECRVPEYGSMEVMSSGRESAEVAVDVEVHVPAGSARRLYERFTAHFDDALERLVVGSVELVAAASPRDLDAAEFERAVVESVREQLAAEGITLKSAHVTGWSETGDYPASVEVSGAPVRKLIVLGVDGGDWLNIEPLVAAGKLPNFKRLMEDGATGPLRSEEPMLSPLLWTTMATGKYPEDHGILNFTVVNPETGEKEPITRHYRQVDAFWNMLSDYGRKVCIAGWLATDPAESINGVMVTDRVGYLAYAPTENDPSQSNGSVSPEARYPEIAQLVVHSDDVTYDEIRRLIDISEDEFEHHRAADIDPRDSINGFIKLYATTRTYHDISLYLLENDRPDLLAVYYEFVDATSHYFMLHAPPRMPDVPEEQYRKFHRAVEMAYVVQDEILGELMGKLDDRTVLMVISDHGFKAGEARLRNRPEIWAGNAAKWHRVNGIVGLYGNGVRKGVTLNDASILDVAPTILALQGLPRAADMPGKILANAFEPDVQEQFNPNTVATLERDRPDDVPPPPGGGAASAEAMKKLEALGYLTPDNADAHNNLGQRYQQRGEFEKAIEEYRKAIAMRPEFYSAYNNLAVCYGKLGRFEQAEEALIKCIQLKPNDFYAMNNLAVTFMRTGDLQKAVGVAERAVQTEPGYVNGRVTLGSVYAMLGRLDEAEKQFREALRIEPGNHSATENLKRLNIQRGN